MGEIPKTIYDGGFPISEELIKKLNFNVVDPQNLPDELLLQFARELSELISADPHMLPVCAEEIKDIAKMGLSVMIVGGDNRLIGYGKLYPWQRERRSCRLRDRQYLCDRKSSRSWSRKNIN